MFDPCLKNFDSSPLIDAVNRLNALNLLPENEQGQANFDVVAGNQEPNAVAQVLVQLDRAGLLTGDAAQANRDALAVHDEPQFLAYALQLFNSAGVLTGDAAQTNFNAIITYSAILFDIGVVDLWRRIPDHRFSQERFTALVAICQRHAEDPAAGRDDLIAYINGQIIDIEEATVAVVPRLNVGQSTHTTSVHQAVSESAARLMQHYGTQISGDDLDAKIEDMSVWLNAQPDSSAKVMAGRRCLQRLTAPNYYFTDPTSGVSTKQLLALFWVAIHDATEETGRTSDLSDAQSQLVEGLYEIQREYNLSEAGEDNGGEDRPSCDGGTFNKIIEKGSGLHPDMVIIFMTQGGLAMKLPRVVVGEAMAYLTRLPPSESLPLIDAINAEDNSNSVGPLWETIQEDVANILFEEFGSLFRNDRHSAGFAEAIAAGEYVSLNLDDLIALRRLKSQELPASQPAIGAATPRQGASYPGAFFTPASTANNEEDAPAVRPNTP